MHHHTENESSLFSLLLSCLVLSSVFFLCLSLSLSMHVSVSVCCCGRVAVECCGVSCCVVSCVVVCVRCGVWCDTLKNPACPLNTSPCVRPKRPRLYRHHAHMLKHVCAWCRYTRGRFERTHGVEEGGRFVVSLAFFIEKTSDFEHFRSILTRCRVRLLSPIFCLP